MDALVEGFEGHSDRTTQVVFEQSGGRIARVAPNTTAFVQHDAVANMLPSVGWAQGSESDAHIAWCREYWTQSRGLHTQVLQQ